VDPVDDRGWRLLERDQRDALGRQRLHRVTEQRCQSVPVILDDGFADWRQCGDH